MLMFISSPAWMGMLVLGTLSVALAKTPGDFIHPAAGMTALALVLIMWFAPVTASAIDVLLQREARRGFGGPVLFLVNLMI